MTDHDTLAIRFEEHRSRLRRLALRLLGSGTDADDAVQDAWIRLSRADADSIENLGGWLTTVTSRIALDRLRARAARPSAPDPGSDWGQLPSGEPGPDDEAELADSVSAALLVVLDTLTPSERLAFVLHDTFAVPFDEIALMLQRSPDAAKQLASRARSKVRGLDPPTSDVTAAHLRVVDAFLAASRSGDLDALIAVLHPDVVLRADADAVAMGSPDLVSGAPAVGAVFSGRALAALPASIDAVAGMVWNVGGATKVAWEFTIIGDRVTRIDMIANPDALVTADIRVLHA